MSPRGHRWPRRVRRSSARCRSEVAQGQVSGAEGQFVDPQVGDELGQQSPRPVETGEIGDERRVQSGDPCPQGPQQGPRPFPTASGHRRAWTQMLEHAIQRGPGLQHIVHRAEQGSVRGGVDRRLLDRSLQQPDVVPAPGVATRSAAICSICSEASMPTIVPVGPTLSCSNGRHSPVPQPTSRTVSPGRAGSSATNCSRQCWKASVRRS